MTNEDYISLELAKKLKEKGFDEPVLSQYSKCGSVWNCYEPENFNKSTGCFSRPTLYEAQKWLREKHNIHLDVRCTAYCKPLNRHDYMCEVFALSCSIFSDTKVYHKYEEALNAGILAALDII